MKKQTDKEIVKEVYDELDSLSKLFDERISDLHNVKGAMQARHAYIYYRRLVWDAMYKIRDELGLK